MKHLILGILMSATAVVGGGPAPDFRPSFDKTDYLGTMWVHVNPWWYPSKPRYDATGGPDYSFKEHRDYEQWGSAFADISKNGTVNFQIELVLPTPALAKEMKEMIRQAKEKCPDARFSVFLSYCGEKDLPKNIEQTIIQLKMLEEEFAHDPSIFRVDGAPVITIYTGDFFTPEEWGAVIPAVEAECGKFIWLLNTCRNPEADADQEKCSAWLHSLLPYFDGITQYGNYSETSQQDHYRILAPIMHDEYPQKIFQVSIQNAYSNHFHAGGVQTKLSLKWRRSVESALEARPDSITMTNFFDHYENSLVLPCYEREDFLVRYAMVALADGLKRKVELAKTPELAVTNYTTIMLGAQNLDFEVIGFPIDAATKEVTIRLDICDTAGNPLYHFPERKMDLSRMTVEEFSLPSETFPDQRGVIPRLYYRWEGRNYELPCLPMTLISPSMRGNFMFWARSTRNVYHCDVADPAWSLDGVLPGGTGAWPEDGISTITAKMKVIWDSGDSAHSGGGFFRIMRNGLEWYRLPQWDGMYFTRAFLLPSPADALNYYHLEYENPEGYKYATRPIWVSNFRRPGTVSLPIRCGREIRDFDIEAARVPYFYYPCDRDEGALLVDRSGYMHNGRVNGTGYGGGHLGYTGYYHYHNGPVNPGDKSLFRRDSDGRGMLHFDGGDYIMIFGGTAFPGASTYEVSIRPAAIGTKMGIFGTANNQINVWIDPDGTLKLTRGSEVEGSGGARPAESFTASVTSQIRLQKDHWYKIAVVYDLRTLKLYVDGKLEGETAAPPVPGHLAINHLSVGALCEWLHTPYAFFQGDLRQIRLYGRNLATNEML